MIRSLVKLFKKHKRMVATGHRARVFGSLLASMGVFWYSRVTKRPVSGVRS